MVDLTLGALPDTLRERADQLDRYAPAAAEAFREAAELTQAALDAWAAEPITPDQAEAEGICSAETVRRKVRSGAADNVGTPGKILVRRGDIQKGTGGRKRKRASSEQAARRAALSRMRRA